MKIRLIIGAMTFPLMSLSPLQPALSEPLADDKSRLIVLTDMGADPDDSQSLVRLLLYSNVIDIRGLVATTSTYQKDAVHPEMIKEIIGAYGESRNNLLRHEAGYPDKDSLLKMTVSGQKEYGMDGVGNGKDSTGSDLIVSELTSDDPRPVWVSVWGGANTLAQALWKIKRNYPDERAKALYGKLRVYAIFDQDDSGIWIRKEFPEVFYIVSPDIRNVTAKGVGASLEGADNEVISSEWIAKNIQQGHGALGVSYPDTSYIMEGDTASFLALIPNGLNSPEHPDYGGWGGRYERYIPKFNQENWKPRGENAIRPYPETRPIWTNAVDTVTPNKSTPPSSASHTDIVPYTSEQATIWRWRTEFQNDFAARISWATQAPKSANHPPVAKIRTPHEIDVSSGQEFYLDATGSHDPDGDSISYYWFWYKEAGSYKGGFNFGLFAQNLARLKVVAPHVETDKSMHFILKVTDKGTPALTRYQRVIVRIHAAHTSQ